MFEDKTYNAILANMLARVPNTIDKREGSIIWDALSPSAAELAQLYIDLDIILDNAFADTATGEYLDKKCGEIGLTRIPAGYCYQKGIFTGSGSTPFNVSIGDRFSVVNTNINFIVTEKIVDGQFKLKCETAGSVGNNATGTIIPISYINGLETATLSEILIYAEDNETDSSFRTRYYNKVRNVTNDGNKAQYIEWASSFSGIGRVKVFSLWNGANTVKVSILDSNQDIATSTLISDFQEYLDPNSEGLGEGVAIIGSVCTVTTASYKDITINAQIVVASGYTLQQAQTAAETAIENHFKNDINYLKTSVGFFKIASVLSDLPQIASITTCTVNSGNIDIALADEEIPNLLSLSLTV